MRHTPQTGKDVESIPPRGRRKGLGVDELKPVPLVRSMAERGDPRDRGRHDGRPSPRSAPFQAPGDWPPAEPKYCGRGHAAGGEGAVGCRAATQPGPLGPRLDRRHRGCESDDDIDRQGWSLGCGGCDRGGQAGSPAHWALIGPRARGGLRSDVEGGGGSDATGGTNPNRPPTPNTQLHTDTGATAQSTTPVVGRARALLSVFCL